jgi:hypothetical protein
MEKTEGIENLLTKYQNYDGSSSFIYACMYSLGEFRDTKFIKTFVNSTFTYNDIDKINDVVCKQLSSHWKNVALGKFEKKDYSGYYYALMTSVNFRIVADYLENNQFNSQENNK